MIYISSNHFLSPKTQSIAAFNCKEGLENVAPSWAAPSHYSATTCKVQARTAPCLCHTFPHQKHEIYGSLGLWLDAPDWCCQPQVTHKLPLRLILNKKTWEVLIYKFPPKKAQFQMAPMVNSIKHLILHLPKLFQKQPRKEYSPTHSMSPIMTLIPKPDKDITRN